MLPFLKGAYTALGDRQFGMWREALVSCASPDLDAWLAQTVQAPPSRQYDEKYNVVTDVYVKKQHAAGLPTLEKAAVAAAAQGPFSTLLDRMNDAIRPETFGAKVAEADQKQLREALTRVAQQVAAVPARQVADRLYQAGDEAAAAALLPKIYADRLQSGDKLLYGVAALEVCDKQAVVHYAHVSEPGRRWSVADDVLSDARAFKARLKCDGGTWPVLTTPEPMAGKSAVDDWAQGLVSEQAAKGNATELRQEKAVELN